MKEIVNVTCCGRKNPIGLGTEPVSFSWQIRSEENDVYQRAYRIRVQEEAGRLVWDSGRRESAASVHIPYQGVPLESREAYRYQVESVLTDGTVLQSGRMTFEMGLLSEADWSAKWIGRQPGSAGPAVDYASVDQGKIIRDMMAGKPLDFEPDRKLEPCNFFYRDFDLPEGMVVQKARIYAAACGIYQVELNGRPVSDTRFAPGFTCYEKTILYQTYDVTPLLREGKNQIRFLLADGWYKGKFGMLGIGENYGSELEMLLQLEITDAEGRVQSIVTDGQFRYAPSPYLYSDILIGEKYDARLEGLETEGKPAAVRERGYEMLASDCAEPVRPVAELKPAAIFRTPKQETVIDFGQNFTGVVMFTVRNAPSGTEIRLEHSEVLDRDGNFIHCVDGFNRDQTDIYICRGGESETYCPQFTFHGFRYAKITGYPGTPAEEDFRGIVIGSGLAAAGGFRTSDPRLNQLQSNIFWSQR